MRINLAMGDIGRQRALRRYPKPHDCPCSRCGLPGMDRHHRNGNTFDNEPENIAWLCRKCHMAEDGRAKAFGALGAAKRIIPNRDCISCGENFRPIRDDRKHCSRDCRSKTEAADNPCKTCPVCELQFSFYPSENRKYCSRICYYTVNRAS